MAVHNGSGQLVSSSSACNNGRSWKKLSEVAKHCKEREIEEGGNERVVTGHHDCSKEVALQTKLSVNQYKNSGTFCGICSEEIAMTDDGIMNEHGGVLLLDAHCESWKDTDVNGTFHVQQEHVQRTYSGFTFIHICKVCKAYGKESFKGIYHRQIYQGSMRQLLS